MVHDSPHVVLVEGDVVHPVMTVEGDVMQHNIMSETIPTITAIDSTATVQLQVTYMARCGRRSTMYNSVYLFILTHPHKFTL